MNTMQDSNTFHYRGDLDRHTQAERSRILALAQLVKTTLRRNDAARAVQLISLAIGRLARPNHGRLPQDIVFGARDAYFKILLLIDLYHPLSGLTFYTFNGVIDRIGQSASLTVRFVDSSRIASSIPGKRLPPPSFADDDSETTKYVDKSLVSKHLLVLAALGEQDRLRSALKDWFAEKEITNSVVLRWLSRYPVDPRLVVLASSALRAHERWARAHDVTQTPVILVNNQRIL